MWQECADELMLADHHFLQRRVEQPFFFLAAAADGRASSPPICSCVRRIGGMAISWSAAAGRTCPTRVGFAAKAEAAEDRADEVNHDAVVSNCVTRRSYAAECRIDEGPALRTSLIHDCESPLFRRPGAGSSATVA